MSQDRSRDASSPPPNDDEIAKRYLAAMTLEEKATLLTGDSAWTTSAMPRLGLPSLRMADGPHGVRRTASTGSMAFGAHAATCFPTASSTSATWDPALLREMGEAIAREAIALEVDVILGPGVNMKRSPLCGRNFEYFSEDPHLAGQLAAGWIEGIQSLGVGASLKHFAVNNQETRRMSVSAEVDERALREIYLPAFEQAVTAARPWTVMCAYNRINGTYASEHHELLTDVLRSEWGFDGFVVSDWAAVHDRPSAVAAGTDLEMPGPRPRRVRSVIDAVLAGSLDEKVVDEAALRVLRVIARANATPKGGTFDAAAHHALARRIAAEGLVLLKNDGVLPLSGGGRLAVIGRAAQVPRIQGGGSSQITPTQVDVPIDELRRRAGDARIAYSEGYDDEVSERPRPRRRRRHHGHELGRRRHLRRDAAREGIRGRRPDGPGPRAAARRADPCGLLPRSRGPSWSCSTVRRWPFPRGSTARPPSSKRGSRARRPAARSRTSSSGS